MAGRTSLNNLEKRKFLTLPERTTAIPDNQHVLSRAAIKPKPLHLQKLLCNASVVMCSDVYGESGYINNIQNRQPVYELPSAQHIYISALHFYFRL
jgi:hypothetical protein